MSNTWEDNVIKVVGESCVLLEIVQNTFKSYAIGHRAKMTDEGYEKAARNEDAAGTVGTIIANLLAAIKAPINQKEHPAAAAMRMIEELRADEGNSVTILCNNPEADTRMEQCAIECSGHWTGFNDLRFYGESVAQALAHAMLAKAEGDARIETYPWGGTGLAGFQGRVSEWLLKCFGPVIAADKLARRDRFLEEALELLQATDYPVERVHALIDYVWGRPKGHLPQEVGGTMVCLAALCSAYGLSMYEDGDAELYRIHNPEMIRGIREKQAMKPTGSALPVAKAVLSAHEKKNIDRMLRVFNAIAENRAASMSDDLWNLRNRLEPWQPGDEHFDNTDIEDVEVVKKL